MAVPINTTLLFSLPKNSDSRMSETVVGITTILIILIASTASLNFGNNSLIRMGATKMPKIVTQTEKTITRIFDFLFLTQWIPVGVNICRKHLVV